jgi:hypothetical protein
MANNQQQQQQQKQPMTCNVDEYHYHDSLSIFIVTLLVPLIGECRTEASQESSPKYVQYQTPKRESSDGLVNGTYTQYTMSYRCDLTDYNYKNKYKNQRNIFCRTNANSFSFRLP